jgi:hypothetical protein
MATRDSAGIYLQILQPAVAVATGIEIDVYDAANYAEMLVTLEGARNLSYQKQLNQAGAGSFKINRHDAKATSANLQKGNLCKVKIDGVYRGAFFMEETVKDYADPGGDGSEDNEVKGRGAMAYMERAIVYPTGWPTTKLPDVTYTSVTRGAILKDQIDQAKARGGLGAMTYDFTATTDSIGNPWTDTNTLTLHIGLNLFDLLRQLSALGTDFYMDPDLGLHAYQNLSIDRTGASGAPAVVFRQGKHVGEKALSVDEHNSAVRSRLLVEGSGGNIQEVIDGPIEGDTAVGRREGYLNYTSSGDTQALNDAGLALMQQMAMDAQPLSMTVTHGLSSVGAGDYEPFVDYDVGDYTLVDVPGAYDLAALRLVSVTIDQLDGGDYTVTGDFNSVYLEALIRIGQKASGLSGGSSSSTTSSPGGSAPAAGSGRVAAEVGDSPGYLFDKITAGAGITKTLTGSAPAETVTLAAASPAGVLPAGGTAGQELVKIDGTDYNTHWVTPASGGGSGTTRPLVDPTGLAWSWLNQGVASVAIQGAALLLTSPLESADSWHFRAKSVPVKPYSVVIHMLPTIMAVNYSGVAVGWLRSSDNHFAVFDQRGGGLTIEASLCTSPWGLTSNYLSLGSFSVWNWVKLTDDSTNRRIWLSTDGYNWVLFHSIATNTDITPDRLIFGLEARNGTYGAALFLDSWEEF